MFLVARVFERIEKTNNTRVFERIEKTNNTRISTSIISLGVSTSITGALLPLLTVAEGAVSSGRKPIRVLQYHQSHARHLHHQSTSRPPKATRAIFAATCILYQISTDISP